MRLCSFLPEFSFLPKPHVAEPTCPGPYSLLLCPLVVSYLPTQNDLHFGSVILQWATEALVNKIGWGGGRKRRKRPGVLWDWEIGDWEIGRLVI